MREVHVIDSHTEGEPTRVVMAGAPEPRGATIAERLDSFRSLFDEYYRPLLLEPRTYEATVGAWIGMPTDPNCLRDVIFFNPAGPIGMCGHGTIGIMATLAHQGIELGAFQLNTPVGRVQAKLIDRHTVQVQNVPSYRIAHNIPIQVPGFGEILGDIAYGGNHFFLVKNSPIGVEIGNLTELTSFTMAAMAAAREQGYPDVNHVEVFGSPQRADADSKNFVLCPSGEYDRSPCGTGTSAKLACLAADGKLLPAEVWTQESIIGTSFQAWYQEDGEKILPTIEGKAFVTGINTLFFDAEDPLVQGISK